MFSSMKWEDVLFISLHFEILHAYIRWLMYIHDTLISKKTTWTILSTIFRMMLEVSQGLPCGSVQFSHSVVSYSLRPQGLQHARLPCPSQNSGANSNSCPSSWWCHPTISSSVIPFFSCLQSSAALGSFQMSQFFAHQVTKNIGVSALASVLPVNIQDWFPLGWTGCISLQSRGLSRVFSNTTVQKHHSLVLSFLYSPTLTSIHDYWKNHSFD